MSDIGILSYIYTQWDARLDEVNEWLLSIRKMRDGFIPTTESIEIPENVYSVLAQIAETFDPTSNQATAAIPLTIKRKIVDRLGDDTDTMSLHLFKLLDSRSILPLTAFGEQDIAFLRAIVASLDDEVTSLYNRIRRYR